MSGRPGHHPLRRRAAGKLVPVIGLLAGTLGLTAGPSMVAAASASVVDFSQCANGNPGTAPSTVCNRGWVNGTLNSANSQYAEGQVVPQRIVVTVSGPGPHSVQISWEDRKGSAPAHAYDSLATWNTTDTGADPCQGLSPCPAGSGSKSTLPIPPDTTPVPPCAPAGCSDVTSAHQLTGQQLEMWGGSLTSMSPYSHSAPSSAGTDDYTTVTVNYTTSGAGEVELLLGGHLAASAGPLGWGSPYGSANINGGPYHFKFLQADGQSAGNRDNSIQAGAILGPAAFTITKSATPDPAAAGATVTYTITVTNTGNSAGSTTFTDANDSRVTDISAVTTKPAGGSCTPETATPTTLDCTTSTIAPGGTQTFTYTAKMPASFSTGGGTDGCPPNEFPVSNTATLASGAQATTVVCVTANPSFGITKKASEATANPGDTVTYTITVTNSGTGAGSTTFTDVNDPNVTNVSFVSSSPTGGTCTVVTGTTNLKCTTSVLAPLGGQQVFTITAQMPASFSSGSGTGNCQQNQFPVTDTATLANGQHASATVCVTANPSFGISKTASETTANPGDTVTYTITVTNSGTAAGSTTFTDVNDPNVTDVTFVSSSPAGGTCSVVTGTTNLSCTTSVLAPLGGQQVFMISVKMPTSFSSGGGTGNCQQNQFPVIDTATLANGQHASATVCVTANPSFVITKKASTTSANPGDTVTYTITVTNDGNASGSTSFTDVNDPNVTDVTFVSSSPAGGGCSLVSGTTTLMCSTSVLAPNGGQQVFTITVKMPGSFSSGGGSDGCPPNQFPVTDTATLANDQDASVTVCVKATPSFAIKKKASETTAHPGDTVTYTITVTNSGTAAGSTSFTDVNDPNVTNVSFVSSSPAGGTCSVVTGTTNLSCTTSVLAPLGGQQVFMISVKMPTSFSSGGGSGGCGSGQFPVTDTVTLANSSSSSVTVCVTAAPTLTLAKTAALTDASGAPVTTATTGDEIVFTISYGNAGDAPATGTTVTDAIPSGTEFLSCTGGCATASGGTGVTGVTWSVGTVEPGQQGSVTLTVVITSFDLCSVSNTADISSPDFTPTGGSAGGPLAAGVTVPVTPAPDPQAATASGTATGAHVDLLGLVNVTLPSPPSHASQHGLGSTVSGTQLAGIDVVQGGPTLLTASLLSTSDNASVVDGGDATATDSAMAETAKACVLPVAGVCTVSADAVLAHAEATASGTEASISSAGSTFVNLKVAGVAMANVAPDTCVALPAAVFGAGSFVGLFVQSPSPSANLPTTCPPPGKTGTAGLTEVNGLPAYAGDLSVTMIDVHVTALLGIGAADVVVSQANAHADMPQLVQCNAGTPVQSVSGHAFVAEEQTTPPLLPALVGYVSIVPSGGTDAQELASVALLPSGLPAMPQVRGGAAFTESTGSVSPGVSSKSDSDATTTSVCILPVAGATGPPSPSTCTIYADAVRSVSSTVAGPTGAGSADTDAANGDLFGPTEFVNLSIAGHVVALPVARNTSLLPAGLPIEVILKEETCANGGATSTGVCGGPGLPSSGLTVTGIHVILLGPLNGLPIGAELWVAQAHSDATFG